MSDFEKSAFGSIFQLVSKVVDYQLTSSALSFLEQRKIKSRVESVTADFIENLAQYLEQQKIPEEWQLRLVKTCVKDLKPLTENPDELLSSTDSQSVFEHLYREKDIPQTIRNEGLGEPYWLLFSGIATLLIKIPPAAVDLEPGNDRRLDQVAAQLKSLFRRANESKGAPPKNGETAPEDNFSFDVSDFAGESAAPGEEVSFTAMYAREIGVETWNTLLVYAHLSSAIESIRKDSERFKDQITGAKEVTAPASTPLARGTEITIVPQCDGITFNPQRITLAWLEDFHRADFRFRADKSLVDDAARGRVDIYVGPLIVGTLKLALLVSESAPQGSAPQEEHGSMYQQDDIFISYSHKDTDIVLGFKKAYEAIGNNILIDIDTLRSGQEWNAELLKMIERAEIFQLFWSENTSKSKYCRQEWEYALKLKKEGGFIRPCYWQNPMTAPPDELSHLHFEYVQV